MPKKGKEKEAVCSRKGDDNNDDEECVKAAAWAWYLHGCGAPSRVIRECDANYSPREPLMRPTRFKLEAMAACTNSSNVKLNSPVNRPNIEADLFSESKNYIISLASAKVDLGSSLFDSYEIVALSKQLQNTILWTDAKYRSNRPGFESLPHHRGGKSGFSYNGFAENAWLKQSDGNPKPRSRLSLPKRRTPTLCNSTQVVVSSEMEIHARKRPYKLRAFGVSSSSSAAAIPSPQS
eukprot:Gb_27953 [translate_table: standard]